MKLHINGRGQLSAAVTSIDFDGITLRIDDAGRPNFWAALRITFSQLEELLAEVRGDTVYAIAADDAA